MTTYTTRAFCSDLSYTATLRRPPDKQPRNKPELGVLSACRSLETSHLISAPYKVISLLHLCHRSTTASRRRPVASATMSSILYDRGLRNKASDEDHAPAPETRYLQGVKPEANDLGFHLEGSGSVQVLGINLDMDSTRHLTPSSVQDFEPMNNAAMTRQRQQHYLFGSEIGSPRPVKQESHAIRPFFDDWPKARDLWSELDDQRYDKNTFSITQLSISVPMPSSEISSRSACSPNDD